jgi:ATP-dependent helicase/nuclease subunit A
MTASQVLNRSIEILAEDADRLQSQASDPQQSVWVAASAGSGKTKVLTDRVLRLLLPRPDGTPGTPPERILCLTFTKAGAAEMAVRINQSLAAWAVDEEDKLHANLGRLLGHDPKPSEMEAARRLFAQVIDSQGGLKILTIHSFCQSILGRFPIEAKLSPHFKLVDERTAGEIQKSALEHVIREADNLDLKNAIYRLSTEKGEEDLLRLIQGLMGERQKFAKALRNKDQLYGQICVFLNLKETDTIESILTAALNTPEMDHTGLLDAATAMAADKTATMQKRAGPIATLLNAAIEDRHHHYPSYIRSFLKEDGLPYAKILMGDLAKTRPELEQVLATEAERIIRLQDQIRSRRCAGLTHDLLRVGSAVMGRYQYEKSVMAALDYDDLIACTLDLLEGRTMEMENVVPWVMFKLDQGIDHILVDEAQDTNPDQWAIIHALCSEFFTGHGARDETGRTIFAVGDEKQSIFGFQRAAPEKFREAENLYRKRATEAGKPFVSIPMTMSFRSTEPVLALTDAVFDVMDPWKALGLPEGTIVQHSSIRAEQAGLVELWPPVGPVSAPEMEPWALPIVVEDRENAEAMLARRIALKIKSWIGAEILEAYDRPVQPGDIMILVKSRGTMVEHLVRALKSANVEVSGVDRMKLAEQIAVQDLLVAAQFALLPEDDLSLASLLKSPLIGLDEEGLYNVAIDRDGKSLWAAAKLKLPETITDWLGALIAKAGTIHPYEFFSDLLHLSCPASISGLKAMIGRLGEDSLDPLEEFLNTALTYEAENIPTLQQFMAWQDAGNTEIKREMESAGGKVRIMTVHASKGLQAPIIILPDTMHTATSIGKIGLTERIVWTANGPLWSPRGVDDCNAYKTLIAEKKVKLDEEYRRLLYVALTRAADRLYVAGCIKGARSTPSPDCWYSLIENGFKRMADRHESIIVDEEDETPGTRIRSAQTAKADKKDKDIETIPVTPACADWSWLTRDPPEEAVPPRPFAPSRPSDPEPAAVSPLSLDDAGIRFRRGNITHSLLQFLPGMPPDIWQASAERFVRRQKDLSAAVQDNIVAEVMAILHNPDFADVFGPGSMAEVPVTALIGEKLISGQIDRLLVTDAEILIVDYKTNRPPPQDVKNIPAIYRTQLRAYRDVLGKIYPGRSIKTFLLWTDGPRMMEVPL